MGIVTIDLNNINHEDTNYNKDDIKTVIQVRLLAWHIKFKKREALKKDINEELILVAQHPKGWWNFCMPKEEEKVVELVFTAQCF